MVVVAQLAERLVVVQEVAGSTPVDHPESRVATKVATLVFVLRKYSKRLRADSWSNTHDYLAHRDSRQPGATSPC